MRSAITVTNVPTLQALLVAGKAEAQAQAGEHWFSSIFT